MITNIEKKKKKKKIGTKEQGKAGFWGGKFYTTFDQKFNILYSWLGLRRKTCTHIM
jgi:hypothetical protein